MPVIVVGADTPVGAAIVDALLPNTIELRAFISDESRVSEFKSRGAKVASGDVSDASHVEGASTRCFCAVLIVDAAIDDRERAFTNGADATLDAWAKAIRQSGVQRAIWVGAHPDSQTLPDSVDQVAVVAVGDDLAAVAEAVASLENVDELPG